jgi:hypothetical protein
VEVSSSRDREKEQRYIEQISILEKQLERATYERQKAIEQALENKRIYETLMSASKKQED